MSEKRSLGSKIGMEWTGIGLGPVDVNLQTKEIHCNYSVLMNRRRVVYYAILLIIILGELLGELNYIIVRFLKYDKHKP